jgi:putative phage-type endonuclease
MQQGTEEWISLRRTKIGASDAPVIMGVSPWKTKMQLWKEKCGFYIDKQQSSFMKRGLALEDEARNYYFLMTGLSVLPDVVIHPTISYMMASLDGITEDKKHIVEIKCPGQKDHETALSGKIPEKYYPQLQHQLAVCGLSEMDYLSYDGQSGVIIKCERDNEYINKLLEEQKAFWHCVEMFEEPIDENFTQREDEEWKELANEWKKTNQELKRLEKREKEIRERLILLCNMKNSCGSGITLSKRTRKGLIMYDKIPELNGMDLEQFRSESKEYWNIKNTD